MSDEWRDYTEEAEKIFTGRRIVSADYAEFTLDDGTVVEVLPNSGCGGCDEGWYSIEKIAACDNVITAVRAVEYDYEEVFELFVIADNTEVNVLRVEGTDNGCYGTGYRLLVKRPA